MKFLPRSLSRGVLTLLLAAGFLLPASRAAAQLYINEIFFDPGGDGSDARDEYIELRGTPNESLTNHYLIFIENELDEFGAGEAGVIENIFDLGDKTFGSNGFLLLRQKFSRYTTEQINPLASDYVNDGPNLPGPAFPGYGSGAASTIGASDVNTFGSGSGEGQVENSGFTAMLIRNDSGEAPVLGLDIDMGNDGLDFPSGQPGWVVLDAIGVFSEVSETEFGRLYAPVNFGAQDINFPLPPDFEPNVEPGAEFVLVNHEVEYIARWGNSVLSTAADWHASNLTDNPSSGSMGVSVQDWRQSGDPHPANDGNDATPPPQPPQIESSKGVPYGTKLTSTLGGPNFITGDYDKDGYVLASDYTVWRDTLGQTGTEQLNPAADPNHDFVVDQADYQLFVANYGTPFLPNAAQAEVALGSGSTVPEPSTLLLVASLTGLLGLRSGRRAAIKPWAGKG